MCSGTLELANGNMVPMRCTYTAKVELLLALILAAVAVAALVTKRPMTVALVLLSLAIVLLTFDTPLSIGVCKSADMPARARRCGCASPAASPPWPPSPAPCSTPTANASRSRAPFSRTHARLTPFSGESGKCAYLDRDLEKVSWWVD